MPKYPTNKPSSFTKNIETYTSGCHVIPHKICANVLVSNQVKHVNSETPRVSNQLTNSNIRSCVQNFKFTNENKITIFSNQPKFCLPYPQT